MSGFSTMNTAISGLLASQRALDVVGQNVVNANTPGYSRQSVRVSSVGAAGSSAGCSATAVVSVGSGAGGVHTGPLDWKSARLKSSKPIIAAIPPQLASDQARKATAKAGQKKLRRLTGCASSLSGASHS